ncbi:hypothetical protein A2442_02115 [Candidatus Campbellbacteria bacterium RIFOXYC2_FULL_35_25]|uniref:Uncharacterized protein n=1 Tax=Candidatus Campbellbacteria bacterium RIFOXYC2_FULL_35_25 TaxID=1797582 RepID=A0A1F5EID6_9BACT|nr:MAG: hypothetical protein A2442_02115 [Candidatus Campbellbacteria bacterium RIFOXYC2_FULL_35_25]
MWFLSVWELFCVRWEGWGKHKINSVLVSFVFVRERVVKNTLPKAMCFLQQSERRKQNESKTSD